MENILIISPFPYAISKKVEEVKFRYFCKEVKNYKIYTIKAFPAELADKLQGQTFDFAYIDVNYISEEINMIREHITGDASKRMKFF